MEATCFIFQIIETEIFKSQVKRTIWTETTFQCLWGSLSWNQKTFKAFDHTEENRSKLHSAKMSLLKRSLIFYVSFLLTERSSGQNKLRDPYFSFTCLRSQSFSVSGVKKRSYWLQHQIFTMDFNDCSEEFPGVWWDWIDSTKDTASLYTHCGLLPTISISLYLSIKSHNVNY